MNILFAVSVKQTVTVASRPSGTLATMMPIMNTRFSTMGVPITKPRMRKMRPREMAIALMMMMKWSLKRNQNLNLHLNLKLVVVVLIDRA